MTLLALATPKNVQTLFSHQRYAVALAPKASNADVEIKVEGGRKAATSWCSTAVLCLLTAIKSLFGASDKKMCCSDDQFAKAAAAVNMALPGNPDADYAGGKKPQEYSADECKNKFKNIKRDTKRFYNAARNEARVSCTRARAPCVLLRPPRQSPALRTLLLACRCSIQSGAPRSRRRSGAPGARCPPPAVLNSA